MGRVQLDPSKILCAREKTASGPSSLVMNLIETFEKAAQEEYEPEIEKSSPEQFKKERQAWTPRQRVSEAIGFGQGAMQANLDKENRKMGPLSGPIKPVAGAQSVFAPVKSTFDQRQQSKARAERRKETAEFEKERKARAEEQGKGIPDINRPRTGPIVIP